MILTGLLLFLTGIIAVLILSGMVQVSWIKNLPFTEGQAAIMGVIFAIAAFVGVLLLMVGVLSR